MKRLYTLASALAIGATAMMAQTMIVVDKSGEQYRFGVDRIEQITFEEITDPVPEAIEVRPTFINPYGGGNVNITFTDANGAMLDLDFYGSTSAEYLEAGTYTVDNSCQPFTIDTGYSTYMPEGTANPSNRVSLTSGTMVVADNEGVYTITIDINLADGTNLLAHYEGELDSYSSHPSEAKKIDVTLTGAKRVEVNDPQPGQFRIRLNDTAWDYEVTLELYAEATATSLPADTYTLSRSDDHTIGSMYYTNSYIQIYASDIPQVPGTSYVRFTEATVNVEKNGSNYSITVDGSLQNGYDCHLTYSGTISGM